MNAEAAGALYKIRRRPTQQLQYQTMIADILTAALGASTTGPATISLATPGSAVVNAAVASRVFSNWAPRPNPPCPPYQHWNKNYWLEHQGKPHFAETASLRLLADRDWDSRWVTWSRGKPTFRMAPKEGAKANPTGSGAHWFDRIWSEKKTREGILLRRGFDRKSLGGGCWDVLAWQQEKVGFVETKQLSANWGDTIRFSQRLWLEAAIACGVDVGAFVILEWRLQ